MDVLRAAVRDLGPVVEGIEFLPEGERCAARAEALDAVRRLYESRLRALADDRPPAPGPLAVVLGGSNVGKSTLVNLLLGQPAAQPCATAVGTKAALLSVPEEWREPYAGADFLPWFDRRPWSQPDLLNQPFDGNTPRLYLHTRTSGPKLALADTPDIDSVARRNHRTAEDLFYLADAVVFVTTEQKYADEICVQQLERALRFGKHVLVVFNRTRWKPSACRVALGPKLAAPGLPTASPVLAVPELQRPATARGPWLDGLRAALDSVAEQAPVLRERAARGAAAGFAAELTALLGELQAEVDGVATYLDAARRAAADEADRHGAFLESLPFDELDQAFVEVLRQQRVPGLDWVYDQLGLVRRWVGRGARQLWSAMSQAFGGRRAVPRTVEEIEADRRERERAQALERIQALLAAMRGELSVCPADLRSALLERLPPLVPSPEAHHAVDGYLIRSEALRQEMVEEAKTKVLETLQGQRRKLLAIRLGKGAARLTTITLVVASHGLSPDDLLVAPAADALLKTWLDQLVGRRWREKLAAELHARRRALFLELLETVALRPIVARLPGCHRAEFIDDARSKAQALAAAAGHGAWET